MRRWVAVALSVGLAGCGWVGFRKPLGDDELRLSSEVRAYYAEVQRAFAAGNAQALSALFDAGIVAPMTKPQVDAWAEKFFAEHGRARLRILALTIDDLGLQRAVVTLRYSVVTPDGKGGFAGAERDTLVRRAGRWYTAAWEKLPSD